MTTSCLYEGWVRHRRRGEVDHELRLPLFMAYLDLDELPGLFDGMALWSARRPAPAWFRRADHLGDPAEPLAASIRAVVAARTGSRSQGPIRLLTNLRYLGHCFNPVSFYYCFDASGRRVEAVVAEVTNTPWGERHAYVLGADPDRPPGGVVRGRFAKEFHVSPFMGMDHTYDWRLTEPGDQLVVHIDSDRAGEIVFDATLSLERRPLASAVLVRHPAQTMQIVTQIYAHAVRTAAKGGRYHPNPSGAPLAGPARRRHARSSRERPTSSGGIPCPRPAPIPAAEPEPVGARR
ncbi:MAG: uncharacterized protein QOD61_1921 [Solirubrobacteraceae bacterium]|nr:uncharacterized protein [Solirubrobacteraceae bacterium]